MSTNNRDEYYDKIIADRDEYILSLGGGASVLHRWNTGKQIYDMLTYPGKKPLAFHLQDNRDTLKHAPERQIDKLQDNPVVQVLQYFVDNTEDRMSALRKNGNRGGINGSDNHEDQIYRELSTSHKKQYFEKLLATIQTRKTYYYEAAYTNNPVVLNESIYIALEKIDGLPDSEKNHILDCLLLQLPNQQRDHMGDIEETIISMTHISV